MDSPSISVPSASPPTISISDVLDGEDEIFTHVLEGHELSEQELRELYDNEEINHFLNFFSTYVTEVRLPQSQNAGIPSSPPKPSTDEQTHLDTLDSSEQDVSISVQNGEMFARTEEPYPRSTTWSLAEEIAFSVLLPVLPEPSLPAPSFTFGRLRLALQRLYLSLEPVYVPFFLRMLRLARWDDWNRSASHCLLYWTLWCYSLLLPALILRVLYSLVRRRIFPYPTLSELTRRRHEMVRATRFSEEMSTRFSASSTVGLKELWRLVRVFQKGIGSKAKNREKGKGKVKTESTTIDAGVDDQEGRPSSDLTEDEQVQDFRTACLSLMNEVADLHERIKNLFIWRHRTSSMIYGAVILIIFAVALIVPAKYIAKIVYFVMGLLFWHVTPVVAALPPPARARLPPALADLPTDADYAMQLISQRVSKGLPVKPPTWKAQQRKGEQSDLQTRSTHDQPQDTSHKKDASVDWKKWGQRAAIGKTWAQDGKRLFTQEQNPPAHTSAAFSIAQPEVETHTFPCQHISAPGLITLTDAKIFFTPLIAAEPKIVIPIKNIHGVKKVGLLKGLSIRWMDNQVDREEKFRWVGGRDELFNRVVGSEARHWLRA